jgi:hypothetical protein
MLPYVTNILNVIVTMQDLFKNDFWFLGLGFLLYYYICNGWIMVDGKLCIKRTFYLNVHIWWEYIGPQALHQGY